MTDEQMKEKQKDFAENADISTLAERISQTITIRSYTDSGCSQDIVRQTTELEKMIINNIVTSAMLAFGYRQSSYDSRSVVDGILDTAEYMLHRFLPEANSYDTVYIPLKRATGIWGEY